MNKEFEDEWEWQQGSLMLKEINQGLEWKKAVAEHFWGQGRLSAMREIRKDIETMFGLKGQEKQPAADD